jgi:hypothetical protein
MTLRNITGPAVPASPKPQAPPAADPAKRVPGTLHLPTFARPR